MTTLETLGEIANLLVDDCHAEQLPRPAMGWVLQSPDFMLFVYLSRDKYSIRWGKLPSSCEQSDYGYRELVRKTKTSINISRDKEPKQIAREIRRRLIVPCLRLQDESKRLRDEKYNTTQTLNERAETLAKITGGSLLHRTKSCKLVRFDLSNVESQGRIQLVHKGDLVNIELLSISYDFAVEVAEFVSTKTN